MHERLRPGVGAPRRRLDLLEHLKPHGGHRLVCQTYENPPGELSSVTIECDTCDEVLLDSEVDTIITRRAEETPRPVQINVPRTIQP